MFTTAELSSSAQAAIAARGTPATLNLDDIFGDVMFTPDGDTVFLSEEQDVLNSGEKEIAPMASKKLGDTFVPSKIGGGLRTTQLDQSGKPALVMGAADGVELTAPVPYKKPPQERHHLQYAMPKKKSRSSDRKMSEQQKVERRERNREHAKRSRIRKKFLLESLQQSVALLKEENEKLRNSIRSHLGNEEAERLLSKQSNSDAPDAALIAASQGAANKVLDDPDFSFIKALQTAQQNFVVTDPSLPDNPIVYASQGFLNLTGYSLDQILGRNCRFLQGPETDPKAVERIRHAIEQGNDLSVCLLNYRVDGTTFWNQFFIAALRDASGNITNFVGVQCKVSDQYAATVTSQQEEEDMGGDDGADD
jgi:PAS domain S-box-containing protein